MGLITNNERYNKIIDVWTNINTKLTKVVIDTLIKDDDGLTFDRQSLAEPVKRAGATFLLTTAWP